MLWIQTKVFLKEHEMFIINNEFDTDEFDTYEFQFFSKL
jgi:hypothetical protein